MRKRTLLLAATASAAALLPAIAAAQDNQLQEVIVTARKRQESILNVPVVETAIPAAQIQRFQTQDLKDVSRLVPGLSLGQAIGALGTQVSLRGVGTTALNAGIDQSVSLNIDGLQLSQGMAFSSGMFDLGQIEVLKGPQALFYGKNSPGGVISLTTADPTDRFELMGRYGHEFEAQENRYEFIASGPVTDTLRVRLAALYDTQAGFYQNDAIALPHSGALTPTSRSNPTDTNHTIRGTVIWKPTAQFDARLKMNFVKDHQLGGDAGQYVSCPDGVGGVPPLNIPFLGGNEDCKRDRTLNLVYMDPNAFHGAPNHGEPIHDTDQKFGTLELNYHVRPDLTVTSTTGYYHIDSLSSINGSLSTYAGPTIISTTDFTRRDWTEELRINSDFAGPTNFTAGMFYQDGKIYNQTTLIGNTSIPRFPATLAKYQHNIDIKSISAFGQVRYKLLPNLELAAGARWTHEKRTDTPFNVITGTPVFFQIADPNIEADNVSPEVTLTYKPSDNVTTFASWKKGFKSGSFNINPLITPGQAMSFGDEKVEGAEVGVKTRLLDRRLAMNTAFYDYQYTGLQVGAYESIGAGSIPTARTLNAGSALVYGIDFDIAYLPEMIDGLTLNGAVNWNHARFKSLDKVPCWGGQRIQDGCNEVKSPTTGLFQAQNLAGIPLVRAPTWQANFGFSYETSIGNDMRLTFANTNQFSSNYLTILGNRPDFYQPKFLKADVSVALHGPRDRWEFAVIGKNLGDVLTSSNCSNLAAQSPSPLPGTINGGTTRGAAGIDEVACYMDRGREVWLRLTVRPYN